MGPTLRALAVATPVLLAAPPAAARVLDVHGSLLAGGMTGRAQPAPGAPGQRGFFERVRGPTAGFEVGAGLLGLDLSLRFFQVLAGQGEIGEPGQRIPAGGRGEVGAPGDLLPRVDHGLATGSLTQLLLGFERRFPLSAAVAIRPRIAAGLAVGTMGPIDLPLGNDDVSHKGLVAEGTVTFERALNRVLSLELTAAGGWHYLLGGGLVVNDPRNWSRGVHGAVWLSAVAHLGF
jgi:hypothetical protein